MSVEEMNLKVLQKKVQSLQWNETVTVTLLCVEAYLIKNCKYGLIVNAKLLENFLKFAASVDRYASLFISKKRTLQ